MTPPIAFLLLLLTLIAWILLPFVPAIIELYRPRDASPLSGVGTDAGELTWFAEGFRRYAEGIGMIGALEDRYGAPLNRGEQAPARLEPLTVFQLRDATTVRVLRTAGAARELTTVAGKPRTGDRAPDDLLDIVVVDVAAPLPDHLAVDREVFARSEFIGGSNMRLRALLAARDVTLAPNTTIVRWAHADGAMHVGRGSMLFGRATSSTELRLASGVRFERMQAPRIVIGDDTDFVPPAMANALRGEPWARPIGGRVTRMSSDTVRVRGNLVVATGEAIEGNIVVIGDLVLERGCQVHGNVKAQGDIVLAGENIIAGSLTARGHLDIGPRSRVAGPVIGERTVTVRAHAFIGTPSTQTTVTAPRIVLERGATVYGAIAAREEGTTGE